MKGGWHTLSYRRAGGVEVFRVPRSRRSQQCGFRPNAATTAKSTATPYSASREEMEMTLCIAATCCEKLRDNYVVLCSDMKIGTWAVSRNRNQTEMGTT